jgi:hypothetical protein
MPAIDKWKNFMAEPGNIGPIDGPPNDGAAITPSDSVDLTYTTRAIYVGADGNVALVTRDGTTLTFTGLKAGTMFPIRASRVMATNTTATGLIALW